MATDLLEIARTHWLEQPVEEVMLLEPVGSDNLMEVATEQVLLQAGADNTLLEPVETVVLLTDVQQAPLAGFDVLIGVALSATRILLNLQDPIELE